ncbi:hypothetical protein [Streptomyces virginiae]|uniref:hypothetical protein n=1 Tax=Streptomyces virginiae TaxID=1961 RepID=UPI003677A5D8
MKHVEPKQGKDKRSSAVRETQNGRKINVHHVHDGRYARSLTQTTKTFPAGVNRWRPALLGWRRHSEQSLAEETEDEDGP